LSNDFGRPVIGELREFFLEIDWLTYHKNFRFVLGLN